jgi:hypothetical protein
VWSTLPGFQWYAPALRAKAGSEVLATHGSESNQYGRLPLIVTKTYGAGKILFMGTDGAWRWRKGVEDKYHYRFWGQVVRWMAYRRNMARGERMSLSFAPEQPQLGQTLAIDARVTESSGEPLSRGEVTARITAPSGAVETVRFAAPGGDGEWGVFAATFTPTEPGTHELVLACKETGDTLDASVFVQGSAEEGIGKAARPEVLAEIAQVTRGKVVRPDEIAHTEFDEGRLEWVHESEVERLPIPVTDREIMWRQVRRHRGGGYFAVDIDCTTEPMTHVVRESRVP